MTASRFKLTKAPQLPDQKTLHSLLSWVHTHAMTMIYLANSRDDVIKGDPKVGGHPSACSSALDILSLLHLCVRNPQDYIAVKPHASPTDHANHYLLKLMSEADGMRMSDERMRLAMKNLRHFTRNGEPVFQSYHSAFDPDHFHFLPSGSVGIPPVNALYLAHAYQMARTQGYALPEDTHFWCLIGDSEYKEGSLQEALPDAGSREMGSLTWIVDYNRQSLDGDRISNEDAIGHKDNDRIEKTAAASGWDVLQLRHGAFRKEIFKSTPHGEALQNVIENALPDYEYQSLMVKRDAKAVLSAIGKYDTSAKKALSSLDDSQVMKFFTDLGGHDLSELMDAFQYAKTQTSKPTMLIAHTIKGNRLRCAGMGSNHSAMIEEDEIRALRKNIGLEGENLKAFERPADGTVLSEYLKARGDWLWKGIEQHQQLQKHNAIEVKTRLQDLKTLEAFPKDFNINLKMTPWAHTQWMLGQITAKLSRISETSLDEKELKDKQRPLKDDEKKLKSLADMLVTMSPDVGTSTNISFSMDGKVFGPDYEDFEELYGVRDPQSPDIAPSETAFSRHIRFDIEEGNAMTCMGSYGKMAEFIGVPFLPLMTVYDFFIKRALDQLFYNLYWKSSFILMGTPSGISLSPEGAQHCWKSDIQIPNLITWEPAFALELDWILMESYRRHVVTMLDGLESEGSNKDRQGVLIRCTTRALEQKMLMKRLKTHQRFEGLSDENILEQTRLDALAGAYYVVDWRGHADYRPGENVLHILTMGALLPEALEASDQLKSQGIMANVLQVSSADLLVGTLGEATKYQHLKQGLGITGDLYIVPESSQSLAQNTSYPPKYFAPTLSAQPLAAQAQLKTLGARKVPVLAVFDGEPGLLDNVGSVLGTLQKTLAVKKHSKSGRPKDVFEYHHMDPLSIAQTAYELLEEAALTKVYMP